MANEVEISVWEDELGFFVWQLTELETLAASVKGQVTTRSNSRFMEASDDVEKLYEEVKELSHRINVAKRSLSKDAKTDLTALTTAYRAYNAIRAARKLFTAVSEGAPAARAEGSCKLTPAEVPKFDGSLEKWPIFYNLFLRHVHNNESLSDDDKVFYLTSKLEGVALVSLAQLVPTGTAYKLAWETLVKQFENKERLAAHYSRLTQVTTRLPTDNQGLLKFVREHRLAVAAYKRLDIPDPLDFHYFHSVFSHLPSSLQQAFRHYSKNSEIPTYDELMDFLEDHTLPSIEDEIANRVDSGRRSKIAGKTSQSRTFITTSKVCISCKASDHMGLVDCSKFLALNSPSKRFRMAKSLQVCYRCLIPGHALAACSSSSRCGWCNGEHHTLLHLGRMNRVKGSEVSKADSTAGGEASVAEVGAELKTFNAVSKSITQVLLASAKVLASGESSKGERTVRCLLDSGSQHHLITVGCCRELTLPIIPLEEVRLVGVGGLENRILGGTTLNIRSRFDPKQKFRLNAFVIDKIVDDLPASPIQLPVGHKLPIRKLADPEWNTPGEVELIIGAELFPLIFYGRAAKIKAGPPYLVDTAFGQVLMGGDVDSGNRSFSALSVSELLERFWRLEEVIPREVGIMSAEERECEALFKSTMKKREGRLEVALPFSGEVDWLGDSYGLAKRRLESLFKKFERDHGFRDQYRAVLQEYVEAGYLNQAENPDTKLPCYFIPHHAVMRADKPKLRIVLDASAKTTSGISLNDILFPGPNLQTDLRTLLLKFRIHKIALTADIRQMYLQILVKEEHRKFLRILFKGEDEKILIYEFARLPFGLKCSPFLAMRSVRQLAGEAEDTYRESAEILKNQIYMDDVVCSVPSVSHARKTVRELREICQRGQFELVKWSSNDAEALTDVTKDSRGSVTFTDCDSATKVLGLVWDPQEDSFKFIPEMKVSACTKRGLLSFLSRIFDPLGLLGPVTLSAKMLLREVWLERLEWDQALPPSLNRRFLDFARELPVLRDLKIPRFIGLSNNGRLNLIGFCDASNNGYGAVVYAQVVTADRVLGRRLLMSKSRVAPLKSVTIPRLELCACLLLTRLLKGILENLTGVATTEYFCFCDSTIALSWIRSSPHLRSVFVANRVAEIQESLDPQRFHHVKGIENPSDCLSRGLHPSEILTHELWWHGPSWLGVLPERWELDAFTPLDENELPESKLRVLLATGEVSENPVLSELVTRVSSWEKLLSVVSYILRWRHRDDAPLALRQRAERIVLKETQREHFRDEIRDLKRGRLGNPKFSRLDAFLDDDECLRVGGRLRAADLPYEAKHPLILPKQGRITQLLVEHYHFRNCHAGTTLLMSLLRKRFWILDARRVISSRVRSCVRCFRASPRGAPPKMGDLPACRVTPAKAFSRVGVDYCGPYHLVMSRGRGKKPQKAYLALFICLTTKALHLEVVADLSTESFLFSFTRFIARRGPVSIIYSDNATNFVGAKGFLEQLNARVEERLMHERVEWRMIPPRSPHFGGIWEANIKSVKRHLTRVMGTQLLSFEEFHTLVVQVECLLNSRPLVAIRADPEPDALTPAHFLLTSSLCSFPLGSLGRLSLKGRKGLLDQMISSYWERWRQEYLHTLQVRQKWVAGSPSVMIGSVVVIHGEDGSPLRWPLGVVVDLHPGKDGIARVVSVRTSTGIFRRSVHKLYPLPFDEEFEARRTFKGGEDVGEA